VPAPRHVLSNVDPEARTGDCAACGPGVRVRHKLNGQGTRHWVCRTATPRHAPGTDRERKRRQDERRRPRKYGLTPEEWGELVAAHGDACAICGKQMRLSIDHCHRSGKVRGLLCNDCNLGLGRFRDDPELLQAAIAYLTR
jgi:hypothetical protein